MSQGTTKKRESLTAKLAEISVDHSKNPRGEFTKEEIVELIDSVRQRGVVQPVVCVDGDAGLELVAGYRRFVACEVVGLDVIPIHIRDGEDREGDAITENMHRADMTEIAEARSLKRYADSHGLNQKEVAKRFGFDPSFISGRFRVLRLPAAVQEVFKGGKPGVSVAPALEKIAKVSEFAAVRVAQMAAEDAEFERLLRRDPRTSIEGLQRVVAESRGAVKTDDNAARPRPPAEGEPVVIDLGGHRSGVDADDLALSDERRAEIRARLAKIAEESHRVYAYREDLRIHLDEADIDALRALGVLLEYDEDDHFYATRYCFDSDAVLDRVEQLMVSAEAEIKARQEAEMEEARAKAAQAGEEVPDDADPEELRAKREKEERAEKTAKEKKKKIKARSLNLDLGRRLLKRRARKRSEKRRRELVRGLALIAVKAEDHLAGLGPRLAYEAWQEVEVRKLKNGHSKEEVTYLEPEEATERLLQSLEAAKTLDDILDIIGDALVAATYADEEELPMTRRVCGYSGSLRYARRGPVRKAIDGEATGVLPPELATALKRSMKAGYADPLRKVVASS